MFGLLESVDVMDKEEGAKQKKGGLGIVWELRRAVRIGRIGRIHGSSRTLTPRHVVI